MNTSPYTMIAIITALLTGSFAIAVPAAEVITGKEAESGLLSWTWRDHGVSLQLVQRLPDQTRAFFLGRGFGTEEADRIARSCVFQTIFRNDGKLPVEYDMNDWNAVSQGKRLPIQTREAWDRTWQEQNIQQGPRIAFRWSLLPTTQQFEPGDYNWGMTSYGLPPGVQFDLSLLIQVDGKTIGGRIPSVQCAADTNN